jgi:hypothetical protein
MRTKKTTRPRKLRRERRWSWISSAGAGRPLGGSTDRSASPDPRSYTPPHLAERILAEQAAMEARSRALPAISC